MLYPSLVIAVLAAIVASQTMITATFQVSTLCSEVFRGELTPNVASLANHQAIVLSSDKSQAHLKDLSWSNIYPMGELVAYGWHYLRHCSIQQCR